MSIASDKYLVILDAAYRAGTDEQDDPVLWLSEWVYGAGQSLDLLLQGNAVSYGLKGAEGTDAEPHRCTDTRRVIEGVRQLASEGVRIFYVDEDARARGLDRNDLFAGVEPIPSGAVNRLLNGYAGVWHW